MERLLAILVTHVTRGGRIKPILRGVGTEQEIRQPGFE